MRGTSAWVDNLVTVDGGSRQFRCMQWANVRFADSTTAFHRGDANGDGSTDISDAVSILNCKFLGTGCGGCRDAMDGNDDGNVDISDPIFILSYLFLGGRRPPYPGLGDCGEDPTPDDLPTCRYEGCF